MSKLIVAFLLASAVSFAFPGPASAPEIDGSTGLAAVTLVTGGLLVLRARRARR
jgi:hypothetical protein